MEQPKPEMWVDEYGDILFSYAIIRVNNQVLTEDLVQETFLSALKGINNFQGKSSLKTWLISILKRKIIDHYRKKSTSNEQFSEELTNDSSFENTPFIEKGKNKGAWKEGRIPKDWSHVENKIESEEFQKALMECLSALPDKLSDCFTMKIMEEQENEEICKHLKITTSNLWVMLHRARLQLRECMEKNWMEV